MVDRRFHYLVLEKCSMTLGQALKRMPKFTEQNLAPLVKQMFIAVSRVHAFKMIHRDVKLDNFLLGPADTVKLCDFGFARKCPSGPACVSGMFGTVPFMSPEMIIGLAYAAPTDVWSLGAILYVLLCGEFPYMPEQPCRQLMKVAVARGAPPPGFAPAVAGVWLSAGAGELLRGLLHRDPELRPSATDALAYRWFSAATEEVSVRQLPCLRDALLSAERVEAFGSSSGASEGGFGGGRSMDRALRELQRKHHGHEVRDSHGELHEGNDVERSQKCERKSPRRCPQRPQVPAQPCVPVPRTFDSHRVHVRVNT